MALERPSERRVKEIIAQVYSRNQRGRPITWEAIGTDQPLYQFDDEPDALGLDSLDAVEIATELEEAFDVVFPTEIDPTELRTVRDVVALLERLLAEQRETAP